MSDQVKQPGTAGLPANRAFAQTSRFVIPELCTPITLAGVFIAAELLAIVATLIAADPTWVVFAIMSLFIQWCALGSAGLLCAARSLFERMPPMGGGLLAWSLVVGLIAVFATIGEFGLSGNFSAGVRSLLDMPPPPVVYPLDWFMVLRIVGAGAIIAGMLLRYLYLQQNLRSREQLELRLRVQALQSRIRPHFLFNSMNIIASLIETDPKTAETVVEDLSELFRASLREFDQQVPLRTELDLCERYARIERLRLGERLRIKWRMDSLAHNVPIPLLTLQPLVENAIYHGIQPLPEGGLIEVDIRIKDERVTIALASPAPSQGVTGSSHPAGNHMALANTRSRLAVLYGSTASFTAGLEHINGGQQFITRLSYPINQVHNAVADDSPADSWKQV